MKCGDSCSIGFLSLGSVLKTHLYQCISWHCCERLLLALVNSFWRLFRFLCSFLDEWFTECTCPHHAERSTVFNRKGHDPCAPPSLFMRSLPRRTFCYLPWWKSPQRETFYRCVKGETKNGRSTERLQNRQVQACFEQWKKCLNSVLHQKESTLKVTDV